MFIFDAIKFSISKRIKSYKEAQIWKKYRNHTKYHLVDPCYHIGEYTHGVPTIYRYDNFTQLTIGKFCSIADGVKFMLGGEHLIHRVSTYAFYQEPELFPENGGWIENVKGDIVIGNDVWIGRDVLLLSGVKVGDGAVIGAGTVVAKDVPPYAVVVGNPSKVIKYRFENIQIKALEKIQWWNWPIEKINRYISLVCSENIDDFLNLILGDDWKQKV